MVRDLARSLPEVPEEAEVAATGLAVSEVPLLVPVRVTTAALVPQTRVVVVAVLAQ
jgi:hypothetical protein